METLVIGNTGCWKHWLLETLVVGTLVIGTLVIGIFGYWKHWLLEALVIGNTGCWKHWLLEWWWYEGNRFEGEGFRQVQKMLDNYFRQLYNLIVGKCIKRNRVDYGVALHIFGFTGYSFTGLEGGDRMSRWKKLPDTEFELMKIVWDNTPPITTGIIMEQYGISKGWKAPTAISLLKRLVERGFLSTQKLGKERVYFPEIGKEEYLQFETEHFMKQYHGSSLSSFVTAMHDGKQLGENGIKELEELLASLKEQGE